MRLESIVKYTIWGLIFVPLELQEKRERLEGPNQHVPTSEVIKKDMIHNG